MKNLRIIPLLGIFVFATSCGKNFLEEKPLDFLSSGTSLVTMKDFDASIYNMYKLVRIEFYSKDENTPMDYLYGTDIVFDGQASQRRFTNYPGTLDPSASIPLVHWSAMYKIIAEANTVLSRLPASQLTDAQKALTEGRARFFRGFAYRTLAYLYGGVPLVLQEVTSPKYDYVRATKEAVLAQVIEDLRFAAANLPGITTVKDGEISNLVAQHLLSEVYLAAGQFKNAITAASVVIDDPATDLMKDRFGSKSTVVPGDVYWDLYRKNNQNRASGNTEGIWVIQFETDVPGGGGVSTALAGSAMYERHHAPMVRDFRIGGRAGFKWPTGDYTGGRGIGWAISTKHFSNTIWASDFNNDIRNANHNFVREFVYNNPAFPDLLGKTVSTEAPPPGITVPSRAFYAYQTKVTTPFDHPAGLYENPATWLLKATAGGTYTDQYMFRLAETYLLRAEAYLGDGDPQKAADDINVVRDRAKASHVSAAAVNIDYILDERMRELGVEEKRRLTLMRLGLVYDRVTRFNTYYSDIQPKHNLFPIPAAEIERNREAVLEQNKDY